MPQSEKQDEGVEIVKEQRASSEQQLVSAEYYEGIIPHPRLMREWEEVVPGSADSIFKRFEEQSKHRIKIEEKVVGANNFKLIIGPIFAFIIAMTTIGGGIWIALATPTTAGAILGGFLTLSGLGTVVTPFLVTEFRKKKEDNS